MTKLDEMWEKLAEYQPYAEKYGFGEAWLRMTTERTVEAANAVGLDARAAAMEAMAAAAAADRAIRHITRAIELTGERSMTYETRITRIVVQKTQDSIHRKGVTTIQIDDFGDGEFVALHQVDYNGDDNMINIDPDEWPTIRKAIDRMITECKPADRTMP